MMILVIGGSSSGKSAYAEHAAASLSRENHTKKYYLATMQAWDEESQKRVGRHRMLRSGKGFVTIEQPISIHRALEKMEPGEKTALLECISNLTANEMFSGEAPKPEGQVVREILSGISILKEELTDFVVVSNNVFEDGISYPEATRNYIRAMGAVNQEIAAMADKVVEVVVGIPITLKPQKTEKQGGQ